MPSYKTLLFIHTHGAFFSALVAFWVFRKTNEQLWADRGQKGKLAMQQWAESCQHNFQHKAYLLEAEEKFCNKDFDDAKLLYANAISSAKVSRRSLLPEFTSRLGIFSSVTKITSTPLHLTSRNIDLSMMKHLLTS